MILFTLLFLILTSSVFADDGIYFYGNVGQSRFSQAGTDGNWRQEALGVRKRIEDFSWGAGIGYKINPYISFEAGYLDFGAMQNGGGVVADEYYHPATHSYNHHAQVAQFDVQGASQAGRGVVKLSYPIGNFAPFLLGGVWGGPHQVTWRNSNAPDRENSFHGVLIGGSIGGGICYQWVCGQVEYYRAFVQTGFPLSTEFVRPSLQVNIPLSLFIP